MTLRSLASRAGLLATAALAACGPSTQLVNTWKAPTADTVRFKKVLAACLCRDEGTRRTVEDEIAKRVANAVPSYTILPEAELRDSARARARVQAAGFDGAIVSRLVSVDRERTYVPGAAYNVPAPYYSMWGYWGYGWGPGYQTLYSPGVVEETRVVTIETNVYRVADAQLIWSSRSRTYDPGSIPDLVDDVIDATVNEMKKENFMI